MIYEKEDISDDLWELLDSNDKDIEKLERKSLTFLQDGWERLKKNKTAMLSMLIIIILIIGAIFTPFYWKYTYSEQNLTMSNIPPILKIYNLEGEQYIYITQDYCAVNVSSDGKLINLFDPVRKDPISRKNIYEINGKTLLIDYNLYNKALIEYKKLEKKARQEQIDYINVEEVEYLKNYYIKHPETKKVSLIEAKNILDSEVDRFTITFDNKIINESKKVRNKNYILGTDALGRDLFIRIIYGARMSLTVGVFAAFVNFAIGVFYGCTAGYKGGKTDNIMMRIVDVIDSIPMMLYVILIMVLLGSGLKSIIIALGATYWVRMARIVRGQVLSLKNSEFVLAAKTIGASTFRIFLKHLIPNMMGPIMVAIAMQIPNAIFTEAFLSFVGLGISAPQASWGTLCNDALPGIYVYPYQMMFPSIAISITILAFNLFSDGLRDAFDPKQRK